MLFLDAFFRFSGIGLLALLAFLNWRDYREWNSAPYLILSCISVSALFIGYAPNSLMPPEPLLGIARFVDIPHLIFVWLFALSLFDKDFKLGTFHIVIAIFYCAPIFWLRLTFMLPLPERPDWLIPYGSATSAILMAHLCYVTLSGRTDDMLEKRRASRIYFVIVIVLVALAAAVTDLMPANGELVDRKTAKILAIWIAIVWGAYWMLSFDRIAVNFGEINGSGRDLDARDEELKERLVQAMAKQEIYRQKDLTIVSLAEHLGVSQHKLRQLINQGLGHPNFSSFVNGYRVDAVKRAFDSRDSASLPILTIAMDCGFKFISPFNNAFKQIEGMTPSEYRKTVSSA